MNYTRTHVILLITAVYVLLPVGLLSLAFVVVGSSVPTKVLYGFGIVNAFFILYRIGYWEFLGLAVRNAFALLALAAVALPFFHATGSDTGGLVLAVAGGIDILLGAESALIVRAGRRLPASLDIRLPFCRGSYLITDGGDGRASRFVNYHYRASVHQGASTNRSMAFAVDIVKTTRFGFTTNGLVPRSNSGYLIFGESVVSPLAGTVVEVTDGIEDNSPFCGNYPYNVGNHIVILCGDAFVLLGHLQNHSITVKAGDHIPQGLEIGRIGNSGLSERPHLHMQASRAENGSIWKGEGIPLLFEGSVPLKGRVFHEVQ